MKIIKPINILKMSIHKLKSPNFQHRNYEMKITRHKPHLTPHTRKKHEWKLKQRMQRSSEEEAFSNPKLGKRQCCQMRKYESERCERIFLSTFCRCSTVDNFNAFYQAGGDRGYGRTKLPNFYFLPKNLGDRDEISWAIFEHKITKNLKMYSIFFKRVLSGALTPKTNFTSQLVSLNFSFNR